MPRDPNKLHMQGVMLSRKPASWLLISRLCVLLVRRREGPRDLDRQLVGSAAGMVAGGLVGGLAGVVAGTVAAKVVEKDAPTPARKHERMDLAELESLAYAATRSVDRLPVAFHEHPDWPPHLDDRHDALILPRAILQKMETSFWEGHIRFTIAEGDEPPRPITVEAGWGHQREARRIWNVLHYPVETST